MRRATLLAEARVLSDSLNALLSRAGVKLDDTEAISRQLLALETHELQRAFGRINSRKKYKGRPTTIIRQRPRNVLFVDEAGKSFPEPKVKNDPHVFALSGIALPQEAVDDYCAAADDIKMSFFGKVNITFHEPRMRQGEGAFKFKNNAEAIAFNKEVDALVEATPFTAFGVGIRKTGFTEFVDEGLDPYLPTDVYSVAIILLMERYIDFLVHSDPERMGRVIFESQGKKENAFHQLEYARHLHEGSQWIPPGVFQDWVEPGLTFVPKAGSDPTELADMLARDIFEWVRRGCRGTPKRWEIFKKKFFRREDGLMGKFGLKIFPDSDIRERVLSHRQQCGVAQN
jgi:hypothetical protein